MARHIKSLKKLIDQLGDELRQNANKTEGAFEGEAGLELNSDDWGWNEHGDMVIAGEVKVSTQLAEDSGLQLSIEQGSEHTATDMVKIYYRIKVMNLAALASQGLVVPQ